MDGSWGDTSEADWADDASVSDMRRWLRDMGALLALPALWVDHEPREIAAGLMSILVGMLELTGAYARFEDPRDGRPLESWRPSGMHAPGELRDAVRAELSPGSGIVTTEVEGSDSTTFRVTSVRLALPWGSCLVLVSAARPGFPSAMETHLLRVAASQGAIAVHAARHLALERAERARVQSSLLRQSELLRALLTDVEPTLAAISRRAREASRLIADAPPLRADRWSGEISAIPQSTPPQPAPLALTRREVEVLGLLAQGLSNKEIAGVMRLSDRTVERHITAVYRKIGVARRSEATAFALRHGMG